jgi:hypothetical protein
MARVSIHFDDETKIDFNDLSDAIFHATQQGVAGISGVEDEDGKSVVTRKQLEGMVAQVQEQGNEPEDRVKAARSLAKEG